MLGLKTPPRTPFRAALAFQPLEKPSPRTLLLHLSSPEDGSERVQGGVVAGVRDEGGGGEGAQAGRDLRAIVVPLLPKFHRSTTSVSTFPDSIALDLANNLTV